MGAAGRGTGLYSILMSRGCRSVSNFYADLAILARGSVQAPVEIRRAPCIGTDAQLPALELQCARAMRYERWRMEIAMLDAIYLAVGFGFLAVAVLYVMACDRI
jgi:hypothetical protein